MHYTPQHGSWLNPAEIEISLLSRQYLSRRRIGDRVSLRKETRAWNRRMNRDRIMMHWSFYSHTGSQEVWLQNYMVTVLEAATIAPPEGAAANHSTIVPKKRFSS